MLRDFPPFQSQPDIDILMNAPGGEDEPTQPSTEYVDPFDDVFGSTPSSPNLAAQGGQDNAAVEQSNPRTGRVRPADDPSDVPRLRSIHATNGYREGIAASKEKHIQEGFDEGYSLGAEMALKAGYLLGAFEGIYHALAKDMSATSGASTATTSDGIRKLVTRIEDVRKMLEDAEEELKVEKLFGKEYIGEDGIWTYNVPGQENEGEVTFAKVAEVHPVIQKWSVALQELCKSLHSHIG